MTSKRLVWLAVLFLGFVALCVAVVGVQVVENFGSQSRLSVHEAEDCTRAINLVRQAQVDLHRQVQEWKDILLRGSDPARFALHLGAFRDRERNVRESLGELETVVDATKLDRSAILAVLREHRQLGEAYRQALATFVPTDAGSAGKVDMMVRGADRKVSDDMDALVRIVNDANMKALAATSTEGDDLSRKIGALLIAIGVIAMLLPLVSFEWAWATP